MVDDDEFVFAELDRSGEPKPQRTPPLRGWDNSRADMADIKDLLQHLIAVSRHADQAPRPWPRPESSFDRWKTAERKKNTDHLYSLLGISDDG